MAAIGAEVPITEACKLLYIPYEVTEEEKSQEVKQVSSIWDKIYDSSILIDCLDGPDCLCGKIYSKWWLSWC